MMRIISVAAAMFCSATASFAVPISLSYSGVLPSGSVLDGEDVSGQTFEFLFTSDTDDVFQDGVFVLPHRAGSFSLNGGAAIAVTEPTSTGYAINFVGFGSSVSGFSFLGSWTVGAWDLASDVAPVTQDVTFQNLGTSSWPISLEGSTFDVVGQGGSETFSGTFSAVVSEPEVIPLPASLLLLGLGLGALGALRRRA